MTSPAFSVMDAPTGFMAIKRHVFIDIMRRCPAICGGATCGSMLPDSDTSAESVAAGRAQIALRRWPAKFWGDWIPDEPWFRCITGRPKAMTMRGRVWDRRRQAPVAVLYRAGGSGLRSRANLLATSAI